MFLSADEFYEAAETPAGGDSTTGESAMDAGVTAMDAGVTTNEASNAAQRSDTDDLTALNESLTADSDGSLPLHEAASSDVHVVDDAENTAANADDKNMHDNAESVAEDSSTCTLDRGDSELINDDRSQLIGDLAAGGGTQDTSRDDSLVAVDECAGDSPSQSASDDATQSQQLDITDSNMSADSSHTQSEPVDSNVSQPSDSQIADDADQMPQCDETSSDNNQQTICTSLPLHIAEEPSTADSNDDPADYVEASTSLNPDCADTEQTTDVDTQQSETDIDVEHQQQQQLEDDDDDDDKDDEQFVDSTSDISPPQPVEGNVDMYSLLSLR